MSAQDQIPETRGFSGYLVGGATYFSVASNFLVGGAPIVLTDVGEPTIGSIFDPPTSNRSPGLVGGGEVNYTFAGSRTQLFLGNRLEDLLRLDIVVGLGVRQGMGKGGIFAVSYLLTPSQLEFWTDPYVEGIAREPTDLDFPGFRLRWGRIFGTGLELTVTDRFYRFDRETSGDWLISEGRLDPDQQPLLDRNGDILRVQVLYRFDVERHRFEPAIRWVDDDHRGDAIANRGYSAQLTYLWASRRLIVDANLIYGIRDSRAVNPIYGERLSSSRAGGGLSLFIPVKRFESSVLNVFTGAEFFEEDANVDFYDSTVKMINAGLVWRHRRK